MKTTDLWFASYIINKGQELVKFEKLGSKLMFWFNTSEQEWNQLRLEFFNSEVSKSRQTQERLKDLGY